MRIAFTYNLQVMQGEEEAEFDRLDTVKAIAESLERIGHEVEQIEVSGPASRLVARLEALNPALIFNTAEGRHNRYREAFYPALFEQLGLPYTGSDAYVCALTLDKHLTKLQLAAEGIPTPRWVFVSDLKHWTPPPLAYPVIVKPNFEGSSKGITQDSVVETPEALFEQAKALLARYPSGVIIEEYIDGRDVTVSLLEKASTRTGGVLPAAEFIIAADAIAGRKYNIYDFSLKHLSPQAVRVKAPADITPEQATEFCRLSKKVYRLTGVRDLGRTDFRLTPDGKIFFIEVNALPSLDPGAVTYVAAQQVGLQNMDAVLDTVIRSAADRQNVPIVKNHLRARRKLNYRVGLTYNLKRVVPKAAGDDDREAEYDAPYTVEAVGNAIASYGHEVVYLEATPELPSILASTQVDFVFNIAEGIQGRNREAQVPAILELLGIPYTGSDPATLSITLDKALSKKILTQAGIPNAKFTIMRTGKERLPRSLSFPVIVKPVAEGSSKGVGVLSVMETEEQLRETVSALVARYKQPALVEEFLSGREFTIGLLGGMRPKVLPPMEIVFNNPQSKWSVYTFEHKLQYNDEIRYDVPANVEPKLARELERVARAAFIALGCRDVARIDLRLNRNGKVYFIECNPLPGLTPGWSDLCLISDKAGMDYRTLIGEIMAPAIQRLREKRKAAPPPIKNGS